MPRGGYHAIAVASHAPANPRTSTRAAVSQRSAARTTRVARGPPSSAVTNAYQDARRSSVTPISSMSGRYDLRHVAPLASRLPLSSAHELLEARPPWADLRTLAPTLPDELDASF